MASYRAKGLRITGIKEIKQALSQVSADIDGPELYKVMGGAVRPLQKEARRNIMYLSTSVGMSVNIADKQPPSRPRKKTVLVVVHKKDTMREWRARAGNRSPNAKVGAGGKVAESLGTMFELGTSLGMKAYHWFRSAFDSTKIEVAENLKTEFLKFYERIVTARSVKNVV